MSLSKPFMWQLYLTISFFSQSCLSLLDLKCPFKMPHLKSLAVSTLSNYFLSFLRQVFNYIIVFTLTLNAKSVAGNAI